MVEKEKEDYEKPAARTVDEEPKKKGLALLIHDLKQKELIPVKILYFAMFSSKFYIWSRSFRVCANMR